MPHVHCGSIIGYIEKRCASAADERRRPSRFCPRYGQHGNNPTRMV